jgi:hypothetical protein
MGALTVGGTLPYAFALGSDGNLWVNYSTGAAWHWANLSHPSGVSIVSSFGVCAIQGGGTPSAWPFVFVSGGDGNLWLNFLSNGVTWTWVNHGGLGLGFGVKIAGAGIGAAAVNGSLPHVFAVGGDYGLWVNWFDGGNWQTSHQGGPTDGKGISPLINPTQTVVAGDDGKLWAFVRSNDGHMWANWSDGKQWHWSDQGSPDGSGKFVEAPMGAVLVDGHRPFVYVGWGNPGSLWLNWWDGAAWHWSNMGIPEP